MSYQETYKDWLTWADEETKEELLRLTDKKEIEDRFLIIPLTLRRKPLVC